MIRKVGVTATRQGLTDAQKLTAQELLMDFALEEQDPILAHGDCVGGDADVHDIASGLGYDVITFPCTIQSMRAFKEASVVMPPEAPLDRNKKIVDFSDVLLVFPKTMWEERRSGTWSTYRYARGRVPLVVVYPNGKREWQEPS